MTGAAIEPMSPREIPTEPGWYVHDGGLVRMIVEGIQTKAGLRFFLTGVESIAYEAKDLTFIARIYPGRIEGREG